MSSLCIQIVEGNPQLRSLLGWHLQQAGYSVCQSADISHGRDVFYQRQPTLAIVDSDLPDGDGLEFCHWLYQQQQSLVLMLSARNTEADVVAGLKAGADDYVCKPFGMQEFLARVEAVLRRSRTMTPPACLEYGDLKIDLVQRRVRYKEESIELTPQEFSLLYVLAQAGGTPLSRTELLKRAWPEAIDNPRTIDTHVLSLRKKIELDPRQPNLIQTVRNVGYRFNLTSPNLDRSNSSNGSMSLTNAYPPLTTKVSGRPNKATTSVPGA
ncbi:response regulator transcription factor [Baaleninema simplex]|uniref:response regulator transcription factor n=1 Tax=Baaleninema simplex TaxID=2862350 RepID=UPI000348C1B8|nr:response regulator transcription factor [Baaleninema simplex]